MNARQLITAAALVAVLLLVLAAPRSRASTSGGNSTIVLVNFDVTVDAGATHMMDEALATAQALHAKAIVIVMNTPGGYLSDMVDIVNIIEEAQSDGMPVYTYVPPDGMAASAGSYIAMASNSIAMGNGSFLGPSTPIVVGGTPLEQNHTEDAMISYMESLAAKWGRNVTAAEIMVADDKAFTVQQAYQYHLINYIANSLQQALRYWGLQGASEVQVSENAYDQFLSALSNSTLDGLLLTLGFIAILVDLYHPTIILTVAGIIAIILGLVGAEVIGASAIGLTLIIIGAAIMFLELKTGHGFAMMAGAAVAAVGIYLLALNIPYISSSAPSGPKYVLIDAAIGAVGVAAGLYIRWIAGPMRRRQVKTGPESLIGATGVALTDLSPVGEVRVEGIVWRARCMSGSIKAGEGVRVVMIDGLTLVVEPLKGQEAQGESLKG